MVVLVRHLLKQRLVPAILPIVPGIDQSCRPDVASARLVGLGKVQLGQVEVVVLLHEPVLEAVDVVLFAVVQVQYLPQGEFSYQFVELGRREGGPEVQDDREGQVAIATKSGLKFEYF